MKMAWIIAAKDIREAFHNKAVYFYILILLFISFPNFEVLRSTLDRMASGSSTAAMETVARTSLSNLMYTLPFTLSMLFCTYLSAYAIILEKAKRTLESLLATPASLRQVWIGKSLAVTLPSIVVTYFVLVLNIVVLNFAIVVPRVGAFVFPGIVPLLVCLIAVPLVAFTVVCIVSILQLTMTSPRLANGVFMVVFFAFYFTTISGVSANWDFSFIYLVILAGLVLIALLLTRLLLIKEKVVLSSKG